MFQIVSFLRVSINKENNYNNKKSHVTTFFSPTKMQTVLKVLLVVYNALLLNVCLHAGLILIPNPVQLVNVIKVSF